MKETAELIDESVNHILHSEDFKAIVAATLISTRRDHSRHHLSIEMERCWQGKQQ